MIILWLEARITRKRLLMYNLLTLLLGKNMLIKELINIRYVRQNRVFRQTMCYLAARFRQIAFPYFRWRYGFFPRLLGQE